MSASEAAGPSLPFDLPPREAAALLEVIAAPPPPPKSLPGRGRRWATALFLLAAGWGVALLERSLGYEPSALAIVVPFTWIGALLVFSTVRQTPPARWFVTLLGLGTFLFLGLPYVIGLGHQLSAFWPLVGATPVLLFGLWRDSRDKPPRPADHGPLIRPWVEVLRGLADDAAPGKRASGLLDLSGPEQKKKLVRSAKAASGAPISIYRDEWCRLRLPLLDGSQLRISGVDRWKVRGDYWKQGARRRKLKPGRKEQLRTVEAQLTHDPGRYEARAAQGPWQLGYLHASAVRVDPGRVVVTAVLPNHGLLEAKDVLALVALAFRSLERRSAA
jgi:hypothetical protein